MPLNRFLNLCKFKGLFTSREGYPCARVTLARGLKLALVYKQISQVGLPYHLGQLYIISKFSKENSLNSSARVTLPTL